MNCNDNKYLYNNYSILTNNLNDIFKNINDDIINNLTDTNKKTRNSKLGYKDVFYYKMLYSFKHKSKQNIVSDINFKNGKSIDRTTYHKKDLKVNVTFYHKLFDKIKNLYNRLFKNVSNYDVIAVDGTYNNTNIKNIKGRLETNLNMGYYNVTKSIPVDITYCGEENKNKEILQLKKYITNNKLENVILVLDRAYNSYKLVNFLENLKLKYVIRVKNNCTMLDKNNKDNKNNKNNKNNNKINNENVRFITYKADRYIDKKDKNNVSVKLKETLECNIITNLSLNEYNDADVKNIYLSRWDIEVFFKLIKYNFKFGRLDEHNKINTKDEYIKMYYCMLIIIYISLMIDKINDNYIKKTESKLKLKSKTKNEYNVKTNKSLLINSIHLILEKIVNSNLQTNDLLNINKNFIKKTNVIKNVSNERKSKTPHTKWYIQGYAEHYRSVAVIDALRENKIDKLNKNLKIIAKNTKIVK